MARWLVPASCQARTVCSSDGTSASAGGPPCSASRWYVYADALPDDSQDSARVRASGGAQELLRHLLDAREHARHGRDERGSAQRLLMDLVDALTNALRAAKEGDSSHTIDLLLVAHEIRNDEKRRLLRAEQHEADAEACLDEALRGLLQLGGEVESHAQDGASSTSCREGLSAGHVMVKLPSDPSTQPTPPTGITRPGEDALQRPGPEESRLQQDAERQPGRVVTGARARAAPPYGVSTCVPEPPPRSG
jgi:hypothetical protein